MVTNYAHRGASQYAPENTLAAFFLGIEMGADGIETDVRRTKDGILILFHDGKLERVTGMEGSISDYTYEELLGMNFGYYKGDKYKNERLVTLEDFLKYFSGKDLSLAIELKDGGIEEEVLKAVYKYGCSSKSTITSFELEYIKKARMLDKTIAIGYLTDEITEDTLETLSSLGIKQICPKARYLEADKVTLAKAKGFSVRAWGVKDTELMNKALNCGVDGMTVNFPDKLAEALKSRL